MRAVSSVVDVSVFLLLVSAAVLTLVVVPDPARGPVTVDERANVLGSVTTEVEYSLGGERRRAHGTVASLLARGAVANATVGGRSLSDGHAAYLEQVRTATRRVLGPGNRTTVVVRWTPYPGSPVRGTVRVGAAPPPGRDVTVATLTVPLPAAAVGERARVRAAGFDGVASVAARATAGALLPGTRATVPTGGQSPASTVASERFRTLAEATGVSVSGPLTTGDVAVARHRAVDGLAEAFAADMRDRFATPEAAAASLGVGTVRITLRRWES